MEQLINLQVQYLLLLPKQIQRSQEWFEMRKDRLTSSDVDTVLGRNPYSKPEEVLFKKCGIAKPFEGNAATRHGQKYEDEAIDLYSNLYKKHVFSFGMIPHPSISFLGGSPDGITQDGIVIEVKCPLRRKIIQGHVPDYYWGQIQLNMEICNLDKAAFIEYRPAYMNEDKNYILNVVHIDRDREWFAKVFPTLETFWNQVMMYRTSGGIEHHPLFHKYASAAASSCTGGNPTTSGPVVHSKPCEIESDCE